MSPTLDAFLHVELPQLVQAWRSTHPDYGPGEPDAEFGAFQAYRRYVEGWTFPQMLHHEQTQGATPPSEPPQ